MKFFIAISSFVLSISAQAAQYDYLGKCVFNDEEDGAEMSLYTSKLTDGVAVKGFAVFVTLDQQERIAQDVTLTFLKAEKAVLLNSDSDKDAQGIKIPFGKDVKVTADGDEAVCNLGL